MMRVTAHDLPAPVVPSTAKCLPSRLSVIAKASRSGAWRSVPSRMVAASGRAYMILSSSRVAEKIGPSSAGWLDTPR
jgi:hypothetical protein